MGRKPNTTKTTTAPSSDSTLPVKRKPRILKTNPAARKVDIAKAIKLRMQNHMSYQDIGNVFGVTRSAIQKELKPLLCFLDNPEATQHYRENRADFIDNVERVLTTHMVDEDKLKAASINNLAYATAQLNNIGRLERGQSTANVAVVAGLSLEDREWLQGIANQYLARQLEAPPEGDVSEN